MLLPKAQFGCSSKMATCACLCDELQRVTLPHGILTPNTSIVLHKNPDAKQLTLKNAGAGSRDTIIKADFKFENMGIGGLDNEFATILRRAFASRYYPPEVRCELLLCFSRRVDARPPAPSRQVIQAEQTAMNRR